MPTIIACANCGQKVSIADEFLGHLVQCPACNTRFVTDGAASEAEAGLSKAIATHPTPAQSPSRPDDSPEKEGKATPSRTDHVAVRVSWPFKLGVVKD